MTCFMLLLPAAVFSLKCALFVCFCSFLNTACHFMRCFPLFFCLLKIPSQCHISYELTLNLSLTKHPFKNSGEKLVKNRQILVIMPKVCLNKYGIFETNQQVILSIYNPQFQVAVQHSHFSLQPSWLLRYLFTWCYDLHFEEF